MKKNEKLTVWITLQILIGVAGSAYLAVAKEHASIGNSGVVQFVLVATLVLVTAQAVKTATGLTFQGIAKSLKPKGERDA